MNSRLDADIKRLQECGFKVKGVVDDSGLVKKAEVSVKSFHKEVEDITYNLFRESHRPPVQMQKEAKSATHSDRDGIVRKLKRLYA